MKKKKGHKLKRYKQPMYRRKKSGVKQFLTAFITIICVLGAAFLGYSAGKPILEWLRNRDTTDDSSQSWTPPVSSDSSETSSPDDSSDVEPPVSVDADRNLLLSSDDLNSIESLTSAVESAKSSGYTSVTVTLIEKGGTFVYKSNVDTVIPDAIKQNALEIKEIADTIKASGLKTNARISVLTDNITSRLNKDIAYTFANEDVLWLDNRADAGGKAWISPFKDASTKYIKSLVSEINAAGFEKIYAADMVFPPFRNYDVDYLGQGVVADDRYKSLIAMLNSINATSGNNTILEISAADILEGTADVFVPNELAGINTTIVIDFSDFKSRVDSGSESLSNYKDLDNSELAQKIMADIKNLSGNMNITPAIVIQNGLSDISNIEIALQQQGFESIMIIE